MKDVLGNASVLETSVPYYCRPGRPNFGGSSPHVADILTAGGDECLLTVLKSKLSHPLPVEIRN